MTGSPASPASPVLEMRRRSPRQRLPGDRPARRLVERDQPDRCLDHREGHRGRRRDVELGVLRRLPFLGGKVATTVRIDPLNGRILAARRVDPIGVTTYRFDYGLAFPALAVPGH